MFTQLLKNVQGYTLYLNTTVFRYKVYPCTLTSSYNGQLIETRMQLQQQTCI